MKLKGVFFVTGGVLVLYSTRSTPSTNKTEVSASLSHIFVYAQTNMESAPSSSRVGGNSGVSAVSLDVEKAKSRSKRPRAQLHGRTSSFRSLSGGRKFLVTAWSVVSLLGILVALGRFLKCRAALFSSPSQSRGGIDKGGASARRLAEGGEDKDSRSHWGLCKSELDSLLESLGIDTSETSSPCHGQQQREEVISEKEEEREDGEKAAETPVGGINSADQKLWKAQMKHKEKLAELRFYLSQLRLSREKKRQRAQSQQESRQQQGSSQNARRQGGGGSEDSDADWSLRMHVKEKAAEVEFYRHLVERLERTRGQHGHQQGQEEVQHEPSTSSEAAETEGARQGADGGDSEGASEVWRARMLVRLGDVEARQQQRRRERLEQERRQEESGQK